MRNVGNIDKHGKQVGNGIIFLGNCIWLIEFTITK